MEAENWDYTQNYQEQVRIHQLRAKQRQAELEKKAKELEYASKNSALQPIDRKVRYTTGMLMTENKTTIADLKRQARIVLPSIIVDTFELNRDYKAYFNYYYGTQKMFVTFSTADIPESNYDKMRAISKGSHNALIMNLPLKYIRKIYDAVPSALQFVFKEYNNITKELITEVFFY